MIVKILPIIYNVLNDVAPKYSSELLNIHQPVRSLHSNVNDNLRLHRPMLSQRTTGVALFDHAHLHFRTTSLESCGAPRHCTLILFLNICNFLTIYICLDL